MGIFALHVGPRRIEPPASRHVFCNNMQRFDRIRVGVLVSWCQRPRSLVADRIAGDRVWSWEFRRLDYRGRVLRKRKSTANSLLLARTLVTDLSTAPSAI